MLESKIDLQGLSYIVSVKIKFRQLIVSLGLIFIILFLFLIIMKVNGCLFILRIGFKYFTRDNKL